MSQSKCDACGRRHRHDTLSVGRKACADWIARRRLAGGAPSNRYWQGWDDAIDTAVAVMVAADDTRGTVLQSIRALRRGVRP